MELLKSAQNFFIPHLSTISKDKRTILTLATSKSLILVLKWKIHLLQTTQHSSILIYLNEISI